MGINLQALADKWPSAIVSRDRIEEFTGGLICRGTMSNIDSRGDGPPMFYLSARKPAYLVEDLIPWLQKRIEAATRRKPKAVPRGNRAVASGRPVKTRSADESRVDRIVREVLG